MGIFLLLLESRDNGPSHKSPPLFVRRHSLVCRDLEPLSGYVLTVPSREKTAPVLRAGHCGYVM